MISFLKKLKSNTKTCNFLFSSWIEREHWPEKILTWLKEQWPIGYGAGFPNQGSRVQIHRVPPRLTQPLWVPGTPGDLMVKRKLSPWSSSVVLRQLKGAIKFYQNIKIKRNNFSLKQSTGGVLKNNCSQEHS